MTFSPAPNSSRLRGREAFKAETSIRPEAVAARLRGAIGERHSVEVEPRARTRRRLAGSIDGTHVRLSIHDDRVLTRRKSWNIEFSGEISGTAGGSALQGTIEVPDRDALIVLVRLLSVGAVLAVVIATALAARTAISGGAVDLGPPTLSLGVSSVAVVALARMKADGEAAAAIDARLLCEFLRRLLT